MPQAIHSYEYFVTQRVMKDHKVKNWYNFVHWKIKNTQIFKEYNIIK